VLLRVVPIVLFAQIAVISQMYRTWNFLGEVARGIISFD
jgi:hypothetical protein